MLKYNFSRILQLRGIKHPYTFLIRNGFPNNYVANILKGKQHNLRNDYLEQFCLLMRCTPNDIMDWEPEGDGASDKSHPMRQLVRGDETSNMYTTLRNLPLDQINEMFKSTQAGKEQ